MGKHFGNLQKISGIIYYRLSPYELKPLKGCLAPGLLNTFKRIKDNFFYISIPLLAGYLFAAEGLKIHEKMEKKNPDDYKDDV